MWLKGSPFQLLSLALSFHFLSSLLELGWDERVHTFSPNNSTFRSPS